MQTTSDALSALDGVIPEQQYAELEDRYAAMVILHWNWTGAEKIRSNAVASTRISTCFQTRSCGSSGQTSEILPEFPGSDMLLWAEVMLECRDAPAEDTFDISDQEQAQLETTEDTPTPSPEIASTESEPAIAQASDTIITETVTETDTTIVDADETLTADTQDQVEPPFETAPLPTFSYSGESPRELVETAAIYIASGQVEAAIPLLRESCLVEASNSATSLACDTLLDIYNAQTVSGGGDISTSAYLTFAGQICDVGYNSGCQIMARYLRAANTPGAYDQGVSYTSRSCDLGDAAACATLASDHIEGRTATPDRVFARNALQRSCDLGREISCREVADLYLRGVGGPSDAERALRAVSTACPAEGARNPDVCVSAADFVLINMEAGEDRASQIRSFIKRACDIGHDVGCAWYAEDLELGIGGSADPSGARQARLTACEYGDAKSCNPRS